MKTIITDFIIGLTDNASSKTARYFVESRSFKQDTVDVVFTLLSIRAKARAGNIEVNGDQRAVTDYVAPLNFVKLIQAGRVWATRDSIEVENEYQKSEKPVTEVVLGEENKEFVAKLVTPEKVVAYFEKYNANQSEEFKVQLGKVNFDEVSVLLDFKSLVSQSNPEMLVPMGAAGVEDLVAFYNGIRCPIDDAYVTKYPVVREEARGRWLISLKSSQ